MLPESDYEIQKWEAEAVAILFKDSAEYPTTQRKWKMRITTANNEIYESDKEIVTIQGSSFGKDNLTTATINFSATCGDNNTSLSGVIVALQKANAITKEVRAMNNDNGNGQMSFTFDNTLPSSYDLVAEQEVEISPDKNIIMDLPAEPSFYPIDLNDIMNRGGISDRFNFHFPNCPEKPASIPSFIPEPNITGDTAFYFTPSPSPSSSCTDDFLTACWKGAECEEENQDSADFVCSQNHGQGSRCTRFINQHDTYDDGCTMAGTAPSPFPSFTPASNITGDATYYTPSTGTTEPQGGIAAPSAAELNQVIISNYADFRVYNDSDDQGSSTAVFANPYDPQSLEWIAKTVGPEKRMYVREIYSDGTYRDFEYIIIHNDQRSSLSNIQILIKIVKKVARITIGDLDLEIDVKNPQVPLDFHLPGTEGQSQQFKIPVVITYSDGSTLYTALTFNYNPPAQPPSAPTPCPYQEDPQNCPYGGIRDCTGTVQEGVCKYDGNVDPNCREICNPAPGNTCAYTESFNCTGENAGCGSKSGEMKKITINTDCSKSSITYCDSACAQSGGGALGANCPEPYPECQGVNTFMITPECDSEGNIVNYNKRDLGDLGQCQ